MFRRESMHTRQEIADHFEVVKEHDLLGFTGEVLLPYLEYEQVKPYLMPDVTPEQWAPAELTEEAVLAEMHSYMDFAWEKVRDERGISASRSVEKMGAWLWILGRDDLLAAVDAAPYAPYGAPKLRVICKALGFDEEG
jgi:hypothetical protein